MENEDNKIEFQQELELSLPEYGFFHNKAGQKIEYWLDKEDKTKCKILVDGQRLDMVKFLEQEAKFLSEMEAFTDGKSIES